MTTFAVIKTGGKQYKVSEGDVIAVEKLPVKKIKDKVIFDEVLMISDGKDDVKVGTPKVAKAKVEATVVVPVSKTKKVTGVKFKAKKRQKKVFGHRQQLTKVKIGKIVG
ncbi:50S ribosomal protein L21 [Patescibacteria group bacterium]|nr:50S ribosomal protein L21 [Patescibacteria group bacterium]